MYSIYKRSHSQARMHVFLEMRIYAKSKIVYYENFGERTLLAAVAGVRLGTALVCSMEPGGGQSCCIGTSAEACNASTGSMTW